MYLRVTCQVRDEQGMHVSRKKKNMTRSNPEVQTRGAGKG